MAFFTRTKTTIPLLPGEDGDEIVSEDDWEEDLEERRTPDGRSSKTSYELRREPPAPAQGVRASADVKDDTKTDDVRYDFVVDRVLGVQV